MLISRLRWRVASALITAGTAAAAVLTLAVPAGAQTGGVWISPEQAGYTATGAQFKTIRAHVYLRSPVQYAGMVASYGHSAQLWSSGMVVTVGVTASTSGRSYTPYATIYNRTTHQVIAPNPNAKRCTARDECIPGVGDPFPVALDLSLRIYYDPAAGNVSMAAEVPIPGSGGYSDDVLFSYTVAQQSFTQARVGTEFGTSPWDAAYRYIPPATPVKVARYTRVDLTSYSGHTATLLSWWVHHKLLDNTRQQLVAVPRDLYNGGESFQTWFMPKSAQ